MSLTATQETGVPTAVGTPVCVDPPLRVVFDTNVLLSLFVFDDSRFAPLRVEVDSGRWQALTRPDCLAEYRRVLGYPLFALDDTRQEAAYTAYTTRVQTWEGLPSPGAATLPKCQDRDDQKFLELAHDASADWLITADKLLLKLRRSRRLENLFRILTPDEVLTRLADIPMPVRIDP